MVLLFKTVQVLSKVRRIKEPRTRTRGIYLPLSMYEQTVELVIIIVLEVPLSYINVFGLVL